MKSYVVFVLVTISALQFHTVNAYRARVLDFSAQAGTDAFDTMENNLKRYSERTPSNIDIIVFPEYGLTTLEVLDGDSYKSYAIVVPEPQQTESVCSQKNDTKGNERIIAALSCLAKEKATYVVVNLLEKHPSKGGIIYNTNVVFNKGGFIVAKYRKINLFGEEKNQLTAGTELTTFKADFGVTFGIFTCFDILFKYPALDILDLQVTDIVYPAAWFSQLPFFAALSVQDGYAKKTGVNLLASGYNNPKAGNGGSGIYKVQEGNSKKVQLQFVKGNAVVDDDVTQISIRDPDIFCKQQDISTSRGAFPSPNITSFKVKNDISDNPGHYNYHILSTSARKFTESICSSNGRICCKFEADVFNSLPETPRFAFVVHSHGGEYGCALVSCESDDFNSCGTRLDSTKTIQFTTISIKTTKMEVNSLNMPITLNNQLKAMDGYSYCTKNGLAIETKDESSVTTFGFYINHATFSTPSLILLTFFSILTFYFRY